MTYVCLSVTMWSAWWSRLWVKVWSNKCKANFFSRVVATAGEGSALVS